MENQQEDKIAEVVSKLLNLIVFLLFIILGLGIVLFHYMPEYVPPVKIQTPNSIADNTAVDTKPKDTVNYWQAPDETTLNDNPDKEMILYGKDIIAHTAEYFGPKGTIYKASTNGMNCQNCHLDAGTKIFGNNYSAVASTYPKLRARSGKIENINKRVNDCFERSLNGKALDTASKEMQAITAYINWLGKDVPKGKSPEGSGLKKIDFLDRAANLENGKSIYIQKCAACHQADGLGTINEEKTAYTYPPLWGEHSYNDGAGLYRISNFAKYIKYNMPLGATYDNAILTDEEAWDIAAYVNSQKRPHKNTKNDWPKIEQKPFDHPFGPYADGFTQQQHKYGPFKAIVEKSNSLKKN
jgi:thiosulfate dehydrogenase